MDTLQLIINAVIVVDPGSLPNSLIIDDGGLAYDTQKGIIVAVGTSTVPSLLKLFP